MSHAIARTAGPVFLALLAGGCGPNPSPKLPEPARAELKSAATVGLSLSILDETTDPCVDFYQYACGKWPTGGRQFTERFEEASETLEANKTTQLRTSGTPANEVLERCLAETDEARRAELAPIYARIDSVRNRRDHATVLAELDQIGAGGFFELSVGSEVHESEKLLILGPRPPQTGATPSEITKSLSQFEPDAAALQTRARAVADLVAKLGTVQSGEIQRVDRAGLGGLAPAFEWDNYLAAISKSPLGIGTGAPSYIERFGELTTQTPLSVLRDHLRWSLAIELRPFMETRMATNCEALVRREFPERLSVDRGVRTDEAMEVLLARVSEALESSAANREWRVGANTKVLKAIVRIASGAKDSAQSLGDDGFLATVLAARREQKASWVRQQSAPRPSTVGGALFDDTPSIEIGIGSVLMVPPLFDPNASDSVNLGRVTATMAPSMLELIGGQLSDEDREALDARAQCFAPLEGDARTTALVTVGALAFVASNHVAAPPAVRTQTHTADQLFFLGYAQASCSRNDSGAVNRTASNIPAFATTFQCPANTPMNPAERCTAW